MATKKTAPEVKEEKLEAAEEIKAEEAAEAEAPVDPWDEEVEMYVPRKPKGDDQQYYVCVNDRRFAVPANGKRQKLPRPVAEVLQTSLDDEAAAEEYAEHIPNRQPGQ